MKHDSKHYYMPLYFDDWIGGTYAMSSASRGVYIMLVIALAKGERVHASIDTLRRLGGDLNEDQYAEVIDKCRIVDGYLVHDKVNRVMMSIKVKQAAGRYGGLNMRSQANLKQNTEQNTEQKSSTAPSRTSGILNPNILNPKSESLKPKAQTTDSLEPRTKRAARQASNISWSADDGWTGITDADLVDWTLAYPTMHIDTTLQRMHLWLKTNPRKANKSNWHRFIVGWLGREGRGGDNNTGTRPTESNF